MAEGTRMLQRRANEAVWAASNYVLGPGEMGVALDTQVIKVGDGTTPWNTLPPAFSDYYLPVLGKAADSELLDGIGSEGFLKTTDATTAATGNKVAMRTSGGTLKAAPATTTDELVPYSQMTAWDAQAIIDARKETVSRSVTGNITLQAADVGCLVNMNNTSYTPSLTFTIPTNATLAIPTGSWVDLCATGKGTILISPAGGVTLNGVATLFGGYGSARLVKTGTDTWQTVKVYDSPGPVLRRRATIGSPNNLANLTFTKIRFDGADSGTALYTNNYDSLGSNEQWSSADNYKCYIRRPGWYDITIQMGVLESSTSNGRVYMKVQVNGVDQLFGGGVHKSTTPDAVVMTNQRMALAVGDYLETWVYVEGYSGTASLSSNPYSSSLIEWMWVRRS